MNFVHRGLLHYFSEMHEIDYHFLAALIEVESGGSPYAQRYEAGYRYLYKVDEISYSLGLTKETIEAAQKTSYGLMQIMGGVAYELGFRGYPTELFDPHINLMLGCRYILQKIDDYGIEPMRLYAAYNAGSPRYNDDGEYINAANVFRFKKIYEAAIIQDSF